MSPPVSPPPALNGCLASLPNATPNFLLHISSSSLNQISQSLYSAFSPSLPSGHGASSMLKPWFSENWPRRWDSLTNVSQFLRRLLYRLYIIICDEHLVRNPTDNLNEILPHEVYDNLFVFFCGNEEIRWFFFQTTHFQACYFHWRFEFHKEIEPYSDLQKMTTVMMFHPSYFDNEAVLDWLAGLEPGNRIFNEVVDKKFKWYERKR
jgi:hypothetical protein